MNGDENPNGESMMPETMSTVETYDPLADTLIDRLLKEHDRARCVARDRDNLRGQLGEARRRADMFEEFHERQRQEIMRLQERVESRGRFTEEELAELEDSNLVSHARREMELAGLYDDGVMYGRMLPDAVMELVQVFALQGHSGMSASIVTDIMGRLLQFDNLTELTSDPDEWNEVGEEVYQSRRNPSMFAKDPSDKATWYDVNEPKEYDEGEVPPSAPEDGAEDGAVFVQYDYDPMEAEKRACAVLGYDVPTSGNIDTNRELMLDLVNEIERLRGDGR